MREVVSVQPQQTQSRVTVQLQLSNNTVTKQTVTNVACGDSTGHRRVIYKRTLSDDKNRNFEPAARPLLPNKSTVDENDVKNGNYQTEEEVVNIDNCINEIYI
jgi:hypothetical protein